MKDNRLGRGLLYFFVSLVALLIYIFLVNSRNLNPETITWGLIIFVVVIAGLSMAYTAWSNKKRRESIEGLAAEMGFNFQADDKIFTQQLESMGRFELFSKGRSRKAMNILRSKRKDYEVTLFDYRYTTGSGRSSQTHYQTIALFSLESSEFPQYILRPRSLLDKVVAKFGMKEIDFSQRPEFSKKYIVRGNDETAIKRVINDAVQTHFKQQNKLTSEANGNQFLIYRTDYRVKPEELRTFLENATQVLELIRRPSLSVDFYDFSLQR
mgnify:CR=1 FL=1